MTLKAGCRDECDGEEKKRELHGERAGKKSYAGPTPEYLVSREAGERFWGGKNKPIAPIARKVQSDVQQMFS